MLSQALLWNFKMYICAHMLSHFSHVRLCVTPWTVARQAPLPMGFSRQEHWCGLLCPPPGDLPDPGIKPVYLTTPALAGGFFSFLTARVAKMYIRQYVYTSNIIP